MADSLIAEAVLRDDERLPLDDDADPAVRLVRLENAHLFAIALDLGSRGLDELLHLIGLEAFKERQLLQVQIVDSHHVPSPILSNCINHFIYLYYSNKEITLMLQKQHQGD